MLKRAGLFAYPWDFADEGVDELVGYARELGITRILLASVYHAGFFLHPHNPRRKTYLLEDGVAYFHPQDALYEGHTIQPVVAAMSAQRDWFGAITERAVRAGLAVSAWNVCLHNTRIGLAHPEATVINAYGDSYPHALSPAHPAATTYVRAVVTDLVKNYPLASVFVEAANYRGRNHSSSWVGGHHQQRDGVYLRPLEEALLSISFNDADVEGATRAGVDVASLRAAVRAHMDQYFDRAPETPTGLPETIHQFRDALPALVDYEAHFARAEGALLADLQSIAQRHQVKLEAPANPAADWVFSAGYGLTTAKMSESIAATRRQMRPGQQLGFAVRMGFNHPEMGAAMDSEQSTCEVAATVSESGADEILFYNYGEAPRRSVEWIKPALRHCGFAP